LIEININIRRRGTPKRLRPKWKRISRKGNEFNINLGDAIGVRKVVVLQNPTSSKIIALRNGSNDKITRIRIKAVPEVRILGGGQVKT